MGRTPDGFLGKAMSLAAVNISTSLGSKVCSLASVCSLGSIPLGSPLSIVPVIHRFYLASMIGYPLGPLLSILPVIHRFDFASMVEDSSGTEGRAEE